MRYLSEKRKISVFSALYPDNYLCYIWVLFGSNECGNVYWAQLFSTNTFSHIILSTSTAIYTQSAGNIDKFVLNFYQRVQIFREYRRNYQDQTNSL